MESKKNTTTGQAPDICVVHLVWTPLGAGPLRTFLSSYRKHPAGVHHDLLVLFNGYPSRESLGQYRDLLSGCDHRQLLLDRPGLDIESYFTAVKTSEYRYYCFLNSYSRILADDWLLKLYTHISKPDAGLASATASWESMYTNYLQEHNIHEKAPLWRQIRAHSRHFLKPCRLKFTFDPFPNYHIRTNGFMISRETMLSLRRRTVRTKLDAYRFESGKDSLTKQVINMRRSVMVVDAAGRGYDKREWDKSGTFKQGNQDNLLIADNQTDRYLHAEPRLKAKLCREAWGGQDHGPEPARIMP